MRDLGFLGGQAVVTAFCEDFEDLRKGTSWWDRVWVMADLLIESAQRSRMGWLKLWRLNKRASQSFFATRQNKLTGWDAYFGVDYEDIVDPMSFYKPAMLKREIDKVLDHSWWGWLKGDTLTLSSGSGALER